MSRYVLDANIFIEAYRTYYSFDIAPRFWTALKSKAEDGKVISIDRIYDELTKFGKEDELHVWAKNEFKPFFESTKQQAIVAKYQEIITWAMTQSQYTDAAKAEFAGVADSWLIAFAAANDDLIVTHEEYKADIKRKIPIPNVCQAFGIPYINTFDMLRRLNIRLG